MADSCVLTMKMSPLSCTTRNSWRPTWWTTGWRKCGLQLNRLQLFKLFYVVRFLRERSINALISPWPHSRSWPQLQWLTLTGRSSFIPARSSSLGLRLLWRPLWFLSNKCVYYMHINNSWNFHQNIFTLTITFIVLNTAIEFVLIYRPHPVYPAIEKQSLKSC